LRECGPDVDVIEIHRERFIRSLRGDGSFVTRLARWTAALTRLPRVGSAVTATALLGLRLVRRVEFVVIKRR
jgi:hypothetical protein